VGFWVVAIPPSPNRHSQDVTVLVTGLLPTVDVSVKYTVRGATPARGEARKLAAGVA